MKSPFRSGRRSLFLTLLVVAGCGGGGGSDSGVPDASADGATDGTVDAGATCGVTLSGATFLAASVGTTVGVDRDVDLALNAGFHCADTAVTFSVSMPGVIAAPPAATIVAGRTRSTVRVSPVAAGHVTLTATLTANGMTQTAMVDVYVTDASVPACTGTGSGMVMPGGMVTSPSGAIALAAGAATTDGDNVYWHVDPFAATIGCAADQLPSGYRALGPAVAFGPGATRVARDLRLTIPLKTALMPAGTNRSHVLVSYTGPGLTTPRIVPVASPVFGGTADAGTLEFGAPRLGTYQAVVRTTAGASRTRHYKFRAITGISMGAMGSAWIGFGHPELFDIVAPMGGPTDYRTQIEYFGRYKFGGFCTAAQRTALGDAACASADASRVPAMNQLFGHIEDFEHWYYQDEYGGQGGSFDRREWASSLFPDTAFAWGNIASDAAEDPAAPNILPTGVPDSFRTMPDSYRCAHPVELAGFHDDEFNPTGSYSVITFCDGSETLRPPPNETQHDHGVWDPTGPNDTYFELLLAVDLNGNHVRDPGEPVIRNMRETFSDVGLDGLADGMEPGYDATTNPDPNGDDYDFAYNPGGTENNYIRDGMPCTAGAPGVAEPFDDFGVDGVNGTMQLSAGGYDRGEGNGCWDTTRAYGHVTQSAAGAIAHLTDAQLADLDVWADAGIRDLLNSLVSMHGLAGDMQARDRAMHLYDGHPGLDFSGHTGDHDFDGPNTPWHEVGGNVLVRYGQPDADLTTKINGDGGHVGTVDQALARVLGSMYWMSARWPGGDYEDARGSIDASTIKGVTFTDSHGRTGAYSVVLPPGYFAPGNAGVSYPVVYFLHGYGMEPAGFADTAALFWTYMSNGHIAPENRIQKLIIVFPDGQCHGSECVQGTFFADAPASTPMGAQNETWMLELMAYIDSMYRTKAPADQPYVE